MIIGPITFEAKVHVINEKEKLIGSVTVGLPPGEPITAEVFHAAVGEALSGLPEPFRLLEPNEFLNKVLVKHATGKNGNFAVPEDMKYDTSALLNAALAANARAKFGDPDEGIECAEDYEGDEDEI